MIKDLLRNRPAFQTVFTLNEIAQLTSKFADSDLVGQIHYYVKKGELLQLTKGIYALNSNYSARELGNKLRTPSYVSLYTILEESGAVFQPYTNIFLVTDRSEQIVVGTQRFVYRKIKNEILLNSLGLTVVNGVNQARLERALADKIYLDGEGHIDNLRGIDWQFMRRLNDEVYRNTTIQKYIDEMSSEK